MGSSAAELLPKWLSKTDPGVKGHGGVASRGALPTGPVFGIRLSMKEYIAWHSRISNFIFFSLLLGTGAILGAINAVGYLRSTASEFLISTSIASLSPHLELLSDAASNGQPIIPTVAESLLLFANSIDPPSSLSQQLEENSEPSEDAEVWTDPGGPSDATDDDPKEMPSSNLPESALMPYPVDLSTLSDVYHDMSEAELLKRASAAVKRRPVSTTPKVAYMFLTRGPLPLAPLWERYFQGHGSLYSIYIHAHPNYHPNFPTDSVFYRRNIPSKEVFWGKFSVYTAERRLLANALLDAANERFVLLSESCIPTTPLPMAYKYFMESQHSFVEVYSDMGRGGIGRYNRIKHRQKLKPEITLTQWRKGSQWFEISRALAIMVVADRKYYPKYESFLCMENCICYVDEHYLATVLTILAPSNLANRTTHYIDFHRRTAHPYQWEPAVITALTLKKITDSGNNCTYNGKVTETCHMFARKFSPESIEPLLKLAATSFGIP